MARCFISADPPELLLRTKRMQQQLGRLSKSAAEASSEPTYLWLPPFPAACYDKIQGSLGRMAQLLQLYHQAVSSLQADDEMDDAIQVQERRFCSLVSTSLRHCLHMLQAPSSSLDHPQHHQEPKDDDLEAAAVTCCCCCCKEEEEAVVGAFLAAHAGEAAGLLDNDDDDHQGQTEGDDTGLLAVCSMGLCMREIIREARQLEAHIIDLNNLRPH